jgi:cytochrome b561
MSVEKGIAMQWRNSEERYGAVAQFLHWSMFAVIALQLIGGQLMDELPKKTAIRGFAYDAHETLGLVLLGLVFLRIAWKIANPAPAETGPAWQKLAARAAHGLLYALLVAIPVVGYVLVVAKGHDAAFFAWDVPSLLGKDEPLAKLAKGAHEWLSNVLIAIVAVHAGAALWHHLVARDGVLRRMLPHGRAGERIGYRH